MKTLDKNRTKLKDADVRAKLNQLLIDCLNNQRIINHKPSRIIPEFTINSGDARVDIATINGKICGYEIKSDADTLERLPSQIKEYNKVFDEMTLVVGKKLFYSALDIVPNWWGIIFFEESPDKDINLYKIRECKQNPNQSFVNLLNLLRKDELIEVCKTHNVHNYSSLNKESLCTKICNDINHSTVSSIVRKFIIANRKSDRSDQLSSLCGA